MNEMTSVAEMTTDENPVPRSRVTLRVRFSNDEMSHDFLRGVQKKYHGRYYQKQQKWSFPQEYENAIRQEWALSIPTETSFPVPAPDPAVSETPSRPETRDQETQTGLFYVYDIPEFYKKQLKQYIRQVQNS